MSPAVRHPVQMSWAVRLPSLRNLQFRKARLRSPSHNSAYWRRAPYIGLGPGAHSLTGNVTLLEQPGTPHRQQDETSSCNPDRISSCNPDSTSCQTSSRNPSGKLATYSRNFETLSPEDIRVERIMLSLRTDKGLKATELYSLADRAVINSLLSEGAP